jgi:UDP-N-acetylmuramate dehydrogenase
MKPWKENEPMSRHTTFKIGGPADFFAEPESTEEIALTVRKCLEEDLPFTVIGNGSNLLVGDRGCRGVIISLGKAVSGITCEGNFLKAEAGALLGAVSAEALKRSLSGMECLSGIPGTIGGALVMNAGAYGGELKDILVEAEILEADGTKTSVLPDELELGYRSSNILSLSRTVLSVKVRLFPGEASAISGKMKELNEKRKEKQPLEYPSAGSAFKRPEGYFAGKLIEEAGLKGFHIGGAEVSEKHCGFIINRGSATAADVRQLIQEIERRVYENAGVRLTPEVKMIGEF